MMIGSMKGRAIVAAAVAVLPTAAWAHPGHGEQGSAFLAGLQHPLTGFDHMAAMLMVGLWAGIALPRHIGAPPLAFIACMLAGFGWAAARSEERRVGKECVSTCRSRWSPYH